MSEAHSPFFWSYWQPRPEFAQVPDSVLEAYGEALKQQHRRETKPRLDGWKRKFRLRALEARALKPRKVRP